MAGHSIPHFQNDGGHRVIEIGVKEFMCTGASVPFDHPHIFIDMGDDNEKVCSYCSTLYRYNAALKADQTNRPAASSMSRRPESSDAPDRTCRCRSNMPPSSAPALPA